MSLRSASRVQQFQICEKEGFIGRNCPDGVGVGFSGVNSSSPCCCSEESRGSPTHLRALQLCGGPRKENHEVKRKGKRRDRDTVLWWSACLAAVRPQLQFLAP